MADPRTTPRSSSASRRAESDFDFLSIVARENGWEMFIDHGGPLGGWTLRFLSPLDRLSAEVTLRYGASLIDFSPRLSTVGQIVAVTREHLGPAIKMTFTVTVGWDWDRAQLDAQHHARGACRSARGPATAICSTSR